MSGMLHCASSKPTEVLTPLFKCTFSITPEQLLQHRTYSFFPSHVASDVNWASFKPLQVAKCLALVEFQLFKSVSIREINFWMKGDKTLREQFAPKLFQLTSLVNSVTLWVATEIVTTANLKMRLRVLQQFIEIAKCCAELKHYDGVLEIVGGLTHNSVDRLRTTWTAFKKDYPKSWERFQDLLDIVDPNNNWANLRHLTTECTASNTPYVPYLGVWTKDLTFIHDGPSSGSSLPKGHVSWPKQQKMATILNHIRSAQGHTWSTQQINVKILQYIEVSLFHKGEKELYQLSKAIEPSAGLR